MTDDVDGGNNDVALELIMFFSTEGAGQLPQ